jgi:hypothetical protein
MAKDPLQVAQQQIAEHRAAIARLEQFVEMYAVLSGESSKVVSPAPVTPATVSVPVQRTMFSDPSSFASTKEIIGTAVSVLRANRAAMPALEIYEQLIAKGLIIAGNKPRANMTAKFSTRKDLLRYTEATGKWSLVEWETATPWLGTSGGPATPKDVEAAG